MGASSAIQFPSKMYLCWWQSEVVTTRALLWLVLTSGALLWLVERSGWWWWVVGALSLAELAPVSQLCRYYGETTPPATPRLREGERKPGADIGSEELSVSPAQREEKTRQSERVRCGSDSGCCCCWWWWCWWSQWSQQWPGLILLMIFPSRSDVKFRKYCKDQSAAGGRK